MNIILMGPPGAGKGTQAAKLCEKYNLTQISTGDLFRAAARNQTAIGVISGYYSKFGVLVPDGYTNEMLYDYLKENMGNFGDGFILDGYPRNIMQARELEYYCKSLGFTIDRVINLDVPEDDLVKRLSGRRTCRDCGATFHIMYKPPKQEGVCDKCGGELYQRADENEEAVKVRLETYNRSTKPLIDYYAMKGELTNVKGDQSMDDVFADLVKCVEAD